MKILLVGGSRFIGPVIIKELLKQDHQVTVFNRGHNDLKFDKEVEILQGDRNEGFNIATEFDVVIDTCAYNELHLKKATTELKFKRYFFISTAAAYKKTEIFPLQEDQSPIGLWPLWKEYNTDKVKAENFLTTSGKTYTILRPVYILGAENHIARESFIYDKIAKKEPLLLPGNGNAVVQFVFAQDIARAIATLIENDANGIFNVCGDENITLKGLVQEMGKLVGEGPIIKFNPVADGVDFKPDEFPFANENFFCSNEKIKKLGVKFTPLLNGLKDDYENYYKKLI